NKFGSPSSHTGDDVRNGRSESSGNPRRSFGDVNGHQINERQMNDHQINSGMSQSSDRNSGQTSHSPESGGWQKFPSRSEHSSAQDHGSADHNSGPGISAADRVDHAAQGNSGGNSRPPLDLHRPIVTPREQPSSQPRSTPPAQRNEPRYNPPSPRSDSRGSYSGSGSVSHNSGCGSYSRGSGGSSSHSSSGGSSSHSGGGSSSHSGGGG